MLDEKTALVHNLTAMLHAANRLEPASAEEQATQTQLVKSLAWGLQAANQLAGTTSLGACSYVGPGGVQECCNLTQAQCAAIGGSSFNPLDLCPVATATATAQTEATTAATTW